MAGDVGGWHASRALARVTWIRAARGKALWVALVFAVLPSLFAQLMVRLGHSSGDAWHDVLTFSLSLLAFVPPLLVAAAIGDDLDDRTVAYLWSRPLPRWALVTGTLLAMLPLGCALAGASLGAALSMMQGIDAATLTRAALAMMLGVVAASTSAAALACWSPRFGTALAVMYVLFVDLPMSLVPAALRQLSIGYQVGVLAGAEHGAPVPAALALAAITAVWMAIALWRVRRVE